MTGFDLAIDGISSFLIIILLSMSMATPIEHSVLRCDINIEQMAHVTWKAEAMYKNTQQSHRSMPLRPFCGFRSSNPFYALGFRATIKYMGVKRSSFAPATKQSAASAKLSAVFCVP